MLKHYAGKSKEHSVHVPNRACNNVDSSVLQKRILVFRQEDNTCLLCTASLRHSETSMQDMPGLMVAACNTFH